ncbi:MAG: protein kinase [Betaproteobacteria bacterium]|nr:protein kinase [Betaproteobacteria bacterium]
MAQEREAGAETGFPPALPAPTGGGTTPARPAANTLPIGAQIREFRIAGVVATGGFGIVYLAQDLSLGRYVALKEYMPASLAERAQGMAVAVKSAHHADTFDAGLRSFVNEARLLAQFDHPSLVKVYRFWEENGTAYMVMPYLEGVTLQKTLAELAGPPDERWLKTLLAPLLDALEIIHRDNCFHRDISPDNILILKDGRPLLLDFGAARRIIGDMNQALTVILKPSYAPPEQYGEAADGKQGAWTDIYALGAVIACAITGKPPAPSVSRVMNDTRAPLAQVAAGRYSPGFLGAVDRALAIRPENRPQSVAEWRRTLLAEDGSPATEAAPPRPAAPGNSWLPRIAAAGLVLAAVGAGAYFASRQAADGTAQTPAATAGNKESAPAPSTSGAFDATGALDRVFGRRNLDHPVTVTLDQSAVKIGRDKLRFRVSSPKAGYLYILMVGTDRSRFNLLFPNAIDRNNRVSAGKELGLPRAGWAMTAGGPAGTNHFVAIVSENPRDFSAAGLVSVDPFGEFPPEAVAKADTTNGSNPFAGKPACPQPGECSAAYGAATFSIQEVD